MKAKRGWYKRPMVIIILGIVAMPVLLVAFAISSVVFESKRPTYYENGSDFPLDKLPPSAHDVRFSPEVPFSPLGRTYEFRRTEADFRDWVERSRHRFPKLSVVQTQDQAFHATIDRSGNVELELLRNFLVSKWTLGDQGFYLVYDPATGRAIRWSHSR